MLVIGTDEPILLRRSRRRRDAEQLALVLAAAGIGCGLAADSGGIALYVDAADAPRAFDELEAYERESAVVPPARPPWSSAMAGSVPPWSSLRSCCSSSACSSATGGPTGRPWARRRRA